ncbi:hypothetical protein ACFVTX_17710 [Agromyces sp. NPDC058136]|uniref:hypothetical protein n=1 Tax=Agromyces sp. NPDC058136 TaxID=3346354 RepID=UPI0036DF504D
MQVEWDETFFEAAQLEASAYWVCFWTGDDIEVAARHDPQRITGAASVDEVLAWLQREQGDRRYELFVETVDPAGSRELVRLGGDFRPRGSAVTITLTSLD